MKVDKNSLTYKLKRIRQQDLFGSMFKAQGPQVKLLQKLYTKNGLTLNLTCNAFPEQYEVFEGEKQVAYYRLRHGEFRIDYPTCGDETIYEAEPMGDGMFDDSERFNYLTKAMRIVKDKINKDE